MIPSRKRALRRAWFATKMSYLPDMYNRYDRKRITRRRNKRDAKRAMRRKQRMPK